MSMSDLATPGTAVNGPEAEPLAAIGERPTWVRYRVLAFLAAMTFVLYLDRVCIGQAAPQIQRDLVISETAWGFVVAAFTLTYALFEIPTGRWGDRFGAGEAGALPNAARVLRAWFPESSRGRAQGFVTTAMMVGGAAAPVASQWLINGVGWRWSFAVFGFVGLIWAISFYFW